MSDDCIPQHHPLLGTPKGFEPYESLGGISRGCEHVLPLRIEIEPHLGQHARAADLPDHNALPPTFEIVDVSRPERPLAQAAYDTIRVVVSKIGARLATHGVLEESLDGRTFQHRRILAYDVADAEGRVWVHSDVDERM